MSCLACRNLLHLLTTALEGVHARLGRAGARLGYLDLRPALLAAIRFAHLHRHLLTSFVLGGEIPDGTRRQTAVAASRASPAAGLSCRCVAAEVLFWLV